MKMDNILINAVHLIVRARYALAYSYPLIYLLFDNLQHVRPTFEFNQRQIEENIDIMNELTQLLPV